MISKLLEHYLPSHHCNQCFAWYISTRTLEPPCLCQQHLWANGTHSWVRISWYCRKLPYSVDTSVWEFYPSVWQTLPLRLDLLGGDGEVSVCPHALLLYNNNNITINNHKELQKQSSPCQKEPGWAGTTPLDFSQWLLISSSPHRDTSIIPIDLYLQASLKTQRHNRCLPPL